MVEPVANVLSIIKSPVVDVTIVLVALCVILKSFPVPIFNTALSAPFNVVDPFDVQELVPSTVPLLLYKSSVSEEVPIPSGIKSP